MQRKASRPASLRNLLITATLAAVASATPAYAASTNQARSMFTEIVLVVMPVAMVIAALFLVLFLLRRRQGFARRDAPFSVIQILPVGQRERVVILRSRSGRSLAIGVSAHSVNLLAELDDADTAPALEQAEDAADAHRDSAQIEQVQAHSEHLKWHQQISKKWLTHVVEGGRRIRPARVT